MSEFTRGFRLHTADGITYDGAEFPYGLIVTAHPDHGLATAYIDRQALADSNPGARIEWTDGTEEQL
ncbi:hypothetical protein ACFY7Y_14425 [Streptomyces virginiae]|uniref:hypothetical protein n=1 Tax=Streptomyces virginiae TaxID=1961 RepID=UPI0036C65D22